MRKATIALFFSASMILAADSPRADKSKYEVWSIDQSNSPGRTFGVQKYLWVADRGRNFLWVVDTETDKIVNRIYLPNDLSTDPTPDLLALSPGGKHVFMSLRGPLH